jgi:hypothetical protein
VFSLFEEDFKANNPDRNIEEFYLTEKDVLGNEVFRSYCETLGSHDSSFSKHWPQVSLIISSSFYHKYNKIIIVDTFLDS